MAQWGHEEHEEHEHEEHEEEDKRSHQRATTVRVPSKHPSSPLDARLSSADAPAG